MLSTPTHSHEVNKMKVQLHMLGGRYRVCELCGTEVGDLVHLLLPRCPLLKYRRTLLVEYAFTMLGQSPTCLSIFSEIMNSNEERIKIFFLSCLKSVDLVTVST